MQRFWHNASATPVIPEQMLANKSNLVKSVFGPILLTNDAKHTHSPRI